ncbi:hypothetical protein BDM02DRAFT_1881025 [Thelephora ganbajun]|uniref:Uncharacterized protein n=1 Tax=Thelephora ganbajun TaxID=370292 RepID=A0ACB6ZUB8_THEGA|nr:hypothetical protein BDM02DRAFT_1881025 [Thelephora ganbajun]
MLGKGRLSYSPSTIAIALDRAIELVTLFLTHWHVGDTLTKGSSDYLTGDNPVVAGCRSPAKATTARFNQFIASQAIFYHTGSQSPHHETTPTNPPRTATRISVTGGHNAHTESFSVVPFSSTAWSIDDFREPGTPRVRYLIPTHRLATFCEVCMRLELLRGIPLFHPVITFLGGWFDESFGFMEKQSHYKTVLDV